MINGLNGFLSGIVTDAGRSKIADNRSQTQANDTAQLFSKGLKLGLGVDLRPSPATDPDTPIFDIQSVVDTVSGFIEQRLEQRRQDGATSDELNTLIAQAREGVERGFRLAREDIESIGRLSPELQDNIDTAEKGINTRIDQLESRLGSDETADVYTSSNLALNDLRSFNRTQASFEFELTTQEGDRILVLARQETQEQLRATSLQSDSGRISSFEAKSSSASAFSIQVQGNLNEDERAALSNLLDQVADISDSFFAGGIADAFNQALALEFDASQIAQFSLDLRASSLSVVQQTDIGRFSPTANIPDAYQAPRLPSGLQAVLADYADKVVELIESAKDLSAELNLLTSGESLAQTLQREFDLAAGRSEPQNRLFDALISQLS